LAIIFVCGVGLMIVAPLLRRYRMAAPALACGASIVVVIAVTGLAHADARIGQAAIDSNRKFYPAVLVCELPALVFALISLRYSFKWAFWTGWAINLAFALYVAAIVVWLEFFWHW
jgi:hypothetical protein